MPNHWYVQHSGRAIGPISTDRLRLLADERKISRSTLIRSDDSDHWIRADRITGLFPEDQLLKTIQSRRTSPKIDSKDEVIYVEEVYPDSEPRELPRTYCPYCAELVAVYARKCKHCGEFLNPQMHSVPVIANDPIRRPAPTIDARVSIRPVDIRSPQREPIVRPLIRVEKSPSFYIASFVFAVIGVVLLISIVISFAVNGSISASFGANDDRSKWDSYSYYGIIEKKADGKWIETDKNTGEFRHHLEETERTNDYIELYNAKRNESYRLYADHMEAVIDNRWSSIGSGAWLMHSSATNNSRSETDFPKNQSTVQNPPNESPPASKLSRVSEIEVLASNIKSKPSTGLKYVSLTLKNRGPRPVRIVDGIYQFHDSSGRIIKEIPYTFLAILDDEPAIKPGETTEAGGFMLPAGMAASTVSVQITKVFESTNDELERPLQSLSGKDPLNDSGRIKDSLKFINMKIDKANNDDVMYLYYADGPIDRAKLEQRCAYLRSITQAPYFSCVVVFDRPENAAFPANPFSAGYGMNFDILDHILATYTYNKRNGYSDLR